MATVNELIQQSSAKLAAAEVFLGHGALSYEEEARWLVFACLDLPFDSPESAYQQSVTAADRDQIEHLLTQRISTRKPLAYLLGEAWFAGLKFEINEQALVPRSPFAELIGLSFFPWVDIKQCDRALEIGTGSGVIAIAMAVRWPHMHIDATDIDEAALALAKKNAIHHGVQDRVRFFLGDGFSALDALPPSEKQYNLVVSNPPYVPSSSMAGLPEEYQHEPELALVAGEDGLSVVRPMLANLSNYLYPGGVLFLEVGEAAPLFAEAFAAGPWEWVPLSASDCAILAWMP